MRPLALSGLPRLIEESPGCGLWPYPGYAADREGPDAAFGPIRDTRLTEDGSGCGLRPCPGYVDSRSSIDFSTTPPTRGGPPGVGIGSLGRSGGDLSQAEGVAFIPIFVMESVACT